MARGESTVRRSAYRQRSALAVISKRPELFETVLVAPEFALGVVSIPLSTLPRGGEAATAEELLDRIGLIPHARFPSEALSKALTALVVNESVDEVVDWLATPPDEVELNRFEVRAAAVAPHRGKATLATGRVGPAHARV